MYSSLALLSLLSQLRLINLTIGFLPFAGSPEARSWDTFALLLLAIVAVLGALLAWFWTRRQA